MRTKHLSAAILTAGMLSLTALAAEPIGHNPLDPNYEPAPFGNIHKGDGAMTKDDYTKYNERNWNDMGVKEIDKTHPRYSAFQKSPRFSLMDKNNDGTISRDEYMSFHDTAWNGMKRKDPNVTTKEEFEQSMGDTSNPLHPQFKRM